MMAREWRSNSFFTTNQKNKKQEEEELWIPCKEKKKGTLFQFFKWFCLWCAMMELMRNELKKKSFNKSFANSYSHYVMLNLVCMEWTGQGTKKKGKELINIKQS